MNLSEISKMTNLEKKGLAYADFLRDVNNIAPGFKFVSYVIQKCDTEEFLVAGGISLTKDVSCYAWVLLPDFAMRFDSFVEVTEAFFDLSDDGKDVNIGFLFESDDGYYVAAFEDKPRRG